MAPDSRRRVRPPSRLNARIETAQVRPSRGSTRFRLHDIPGNRLWVPKWFLSLQREADAKAG
jgi:hypothetical protein